MIFLSWFISNKLQLNGASGVWLAQVGDTLTHVTSMLVGFFYNKKKNIVISFIYD